MVIIQLLKNAKTMNKKITSKMKAKFLVPNVEFALHGFNGQIPVFPESSLESSWIVFCSQISL
jgi:hypothetical protein